ncbi:protein kinase [Streptomyces sp. NPDC048484]|uniref:protein kinase domain-containing protein n=1 Tax=Streptomyces sp. NPDC048484 TaxID=3155146 RepID=UPI00343AC1BE
MDGLTPDDPGWIGNYRLLGRLGEGGMGRVYLARSDRGRTVAVKVVQEQLARKPDFRRRFAQEVKAAQRVGGEWTAPVLDADTDAPTPWVATGYVAGPSLTEVVDKQYGPLPPRSVRALAIGLVHALRAIHGAGLVHRDLKPSNVLVTIDGPRVIDFGIARALDATTQSADGLTMTGVVVGSPGFMSPEQVRGERVTYASDIFCLGAVLAYTAAGRLPFGTGEGGVHSLLFRIATEEPDLTGVPEPWDRLIAWCLTKDPAQRPSLDDLLTRIEALEDTGGAWLPGEVLAELGRHAVQLLDIENPQSQALSEQAVAFGPGGRSSGSGTGTGPGAGPGSGPGAGPDSGSGSWPGAGPGPGSGAVQTPVPGLADPAPQGFGPPVAYNPSAPLWHSPPPGSPHAGSPQPGSLPPSPHYFSPRPPARSARGLGTGLSLLLGLYTLPLLVRGAVLGWTYLRLDGQDSEADPSRIPNYEMLQLATDASEFLALPVALALMIVWPLWFQRMRNNADAFAPVRLRFAPGMAAGAWFIPGVNFFMPKQMSNDIWTATAGQARGARRWLLHVWWWCWVVYMVAYVQDSFGSWYQNDTAGGAMIDIIDAQVAVVTGVVSAVVAVFFVRRLTSMQQNRIEETRDAGLS